MSIWRKLLAMIGLRPLSAPRNFQVSESFHVTLTTLFLRRAFTAYQTVHLLEGTSASPHPHILLDLLATFQDEQIKPQEAERLLTLCILHLERLCIVAPVALCLQPCIVEEKAFLLKRLTDRAD